MNMQGLMTLWKSSSPRPDTRTSPSDETKLKTYMHKGFRAIMCGSWVGSGPARRWAHERRDMSRSPEAARGAGDRRTTRRGGTDQEGSGAGEPARGALAHGERWPPECRGRTLGRQQADGGGDVAAPAAQRLGVPH